MNIPHPGAATGPEDSDVIVLGSGVAANALAVVLAKHGVRVTVAAESGRQPFGRGEMLGRYSALLLRTLAARYAVPEFAHLTSLAELTRIVGASGGMERCHGFVYHRAGQAQNPDELLQMSPPKTIPPEPSLYRPEVEEYLAGTAEKYGARRLTDVRIEEVEASSEGVRVTLDGGKVLTGRYLVDAGDRNSAFAARWGLHEDPCPLSSQTRSLYTHMRGVRSFDDVFGGEAYQAPTPWHEGSVRHLFDGGWLEIFDFGNRPESTNHTQSVCLNLDAVRFPAGASPEADFQDFLARFPSIAPLFEKAEPTGPWLTEERQQYVCATTVGPRWCVIGEAAGYVDPWLNRGLITSLEQVNALAWRLLDAVRDGDFATERFAAMHRITRRLLAGDDRVVSLITASLTDHALWRSALSVFETGLRFGQFVMQRAANTLLETGSDEEVRALEDIEFFGSVFPGHAGYNELLNNAVAECAAAAEGRRKPQEAADTLLRWLHEADWVPDFFVLDTSARFPHLTPKDLQALEQWARGDAPADVGALALTAIETLKKQAMAAQRQ
ncbi:NAD(P)/FAD-dependent oxidoreductase [Streptomyces litchfieldiae]|uniref:Halogenase n=1 Tax=Streptomyces litchfieldiae TaxID=3075543 RepID=A0ABU2MZ40_9ACTN|nr:hypothetical protein [Streptomyces sp. DSM 44938]MDT0346927.1 hypothetical protein [Streptomyces sp. DSM 44938]